MPAPESRLTLTREIARSAIATVWEGFDSSLDRKVLVKSIHPQYARESDLRARFEREAKAIAKLSHPNVVQIFDLRTDGDELSLILEFVEGTTLRRVLKERGPLPAEAALTITDEILAGLEQAHAAGIIHRDLKPENVLVSTRGEVKITDFGLASLRDQPTVTQEGMVVGTPSYMAPEQATGGEILPATDIFAVGLMLFEMLTGQRVHEGATMAETFQNVLKYQSPKLDSYGEQIPETLRPMLAAMLEKSAAKRPSRVSEVRQALLERSRDDRLPRTLLQDFLSGEPTRKATTPAVARVRAWSKPFRWFTLVTLFVAGGGLIFHLATLTEKSVPEIGDEGINPAESVTVFLPTTSENEMTARDTTPISPADPAGEESTRPIAGRVVEPIPSDRFPEPVMVERPGYLSIVSQPWAQVYLGDSLIGNTPLGAAIELSPGEHNVVFLNPEIGLPVIRKARVEGGDTTLLRVNLYENVGRIRAASVKPWADVYIDGTNVLRTPSSKTIFLTLGTHLVTLRHPDFPEYTDTLTFREGDLMHEIRVDLSQPR